MTCRVARSYQHFVQMEPVPCSECGSTYMEGRVTSGTLGPHLCPTCAQSVSMGSAWKEDATRVPMRPQKVA
jgi:predicted Zn-ribbon and HTH transcriptional regulator